MPIEKVCEECGDLTAQLTNVASVVNGQRYYANICELCNLKRVAGKKKARTLLKQFAFEKYRVPRKEQEVVPRDRQVKELFVKDKATLRLSQRIAARMRAGALVVVVQDPDEQLALAEIKAAAGMFNPVTVMSVSDEDANEKLQEHPKAAGCLIFMDYLSVYLENPMALRQIRDVALQRRAAGQKFSRLILLEKPEVQIPTYLSGDVEIVRPSLPSVEELSDELTAFLDSQPEIEIEGNGETKYSLASAMAGLSRHEANRLFARCWVENKQMDPAWLRTQKAKVVTARLGGALTFESFPEIRVGGLGNLKKWLVSRKGAFASAAAKKFGLPEPKGLMLLGVPGGGKSLTAKYIAQLMELPLMRLDIGRLFGSLVGQSESQARSAIEAAEASAPCVLWLDEIEKGLGGTGSGGDSGTTARVFGTILTWLQEKTSPVFVIATANDISRLPPELLRKGRFDEIFYVGLPDTMERREIFTIHIERSGRSLLPEKVSALAEASGGFTGAEIEQAVIEGLFTAFGSERNLTYEDVLKALKETTPLSRTMAEKIKSIEEWAKTRARHASKVAATEEDGYARPGIV